MLIDEVMPHYEFAEFHELRVQAGFERTYAAIANTNLASNPVVRILLAVRAAPARLFGPKAQRSFSRSLTLRDAERFGFFITAEDPPHEIVVALQGKFWTITGGTECATREALNEPIPPFTARAVWNFSVRPAGAAACVLSTETRIKCSDASARRRFRVYWFFVRPGSGIIRRMILRTIRKTAESP